jgi:hypothetical protein
MLDAASEDLLAHLAEEISDEALLRIGYYAESGTQLTRAVGVLPEARLRGLVHHALTGPPDLRSAGLTIVGRLSDERLCGRLAGYAAEEDDDVLTALLRMALDEGAVGEMLHAVATMDEPPLRRVVNLPALEDAGVRTRLEQAARELSLGHLLGRFAELRSDT